MAFEHNRTIQTESGFWDDNLASQPFTDFEGFSGQAVESFTADIFGRTFNGFVSHRLEQTYQPMDRYPFAFAALINYIYSIPGTQAPHAKLQLLRVQQNPHIPKPDSYFGVDSDFNASTLKVFTRFYFTRVVLQRLKASSGTGSSPDCHA